MPELLQIFEDEGKFIAAHNPKPSPVYEQKLVEVSDLVFNAKYHGQSISSSRRKVMLEEAMTTSDFSLLMGDVLDRQLLANYKATDPTWKPIARQSLVNDFRINRRFRVWGADTLMAQVNENDEYPIVRKGTIEYNIHALKYGKRFDISFESIVNDDLGALQDTAQRFANAAIRTESYNTAILFANDQGAHMDETTVVPGHLFDLTGQNNTQINAVRTLLTINSLTAAIQAMALFTDPAGNVILNRPKYLYIPPALEYTARSILTSTFRMWVDQAGGNTPTSYPTSNPISQYGLQVIVDPFLPVVDTTNGNTAWYLFADPADCPAIEVCHMQGHEVPEICMHASNAITVGGAPMSPMSGDFENDNIKYRVRLISGNTKLDWRGCYAGGLVN